MQNKDIFLAVLVAVAWGGFFTSNKISLDTIPTSIFGFFRYFSVFLLTLPFFIKSFKTNIYVLLMSIVYFLDSIFILEATVISESTMPIIIIKQLVVPFTIILGFFIFKEKISSNTLIGSVLVVMGSVLAIDYNDMSEVSSYALSFCVISALMFAIYNILARKLTDMKPLVLLSQLSLAVSIFFFVSAIFKDEFQSLNKVSSESLVALAYSIFIVSIFGNGVWFYLLKKYPLSKVAPFTILIPIFASIISVIKLDESITISLILGVVIVVIGLVIIQKNKTCS